MHIKIKDSANGLNELSSMIYLKLGVCAVCSVQHACIIVLSSTEFTLLHQYLGHTVVVTCLNGGI